MFDSNSSYSSSEHHSNFDNISKILLIGETGAGKSTFINYLYNYFHKGDLNNLKIAIPCKYHPNTTEQFTHHELNIHDNTQSKTTSCTQYIFTDSTTNKQYLFLDTPGLSDTRGIEQNDININKILDAITQLGNLTSIIIVINGSISRLTVNVRSVIACLNGYIPDIILQNVIVILTNVKKHESSFDLNVLNLNGKVYPFYMQNGAFVSDPQTWTKSILNELQNDWNHSMNQIKCIIQTLDSFKQLSIDAFIKMKQIRNEIKLTIHQARIEMVKIQKIQDELSQLNHSYTQVNQDTINYHDNARFETIDIIDAPYHSTLCANCNQVCHDNCQLNETTTIGAQIFSQCLVMINGKCTQCRHHCSYISHYHAKKTIQITYETLYDILNKIKNKYDYTYQNCNNYQEKILTISQTKEILEKALKEKLHEIKIKSMKLYEICSSFNIAKEFQYLIQQLKIESDLLQNFETKLQAEKIIKYLIKFSHAIEEKQETYKQKRLSSMQIINQEHFFEKKPIDVNYLKTADLIQLYHNTIDHSLITSILNELHQRVQGKSIGPLLTSNDIMIINKNLEKYNHKSVQELSYLYLKLQKQIENLIKSDILKILNVNTELLIENFTVQTLLDDKEKHENHNSQHTSMQIISQPVYPPVPYSNIQTMPQPVHSPLPSPNIQTIPQPVHPPFPSPNIQTIPQPVHPPFPSPNIQTVPQSVLQPVHPPLPYPNTQSIPLQKSTSSVNLSSIGFSHLISPPYPSSNAPSPLPALPPDYLPIIPFNKHQPKTLFRLEDYRLNSPDIKSNTSDIDYLSFMPMPVPMLTSIPMNNRQPSTNLYKSKSEFALNNPLENQNMISSNHHSSIPDVVPINSDLFGSSKILSNYLHKDAINNLDNESFHLLDNLSLLSMYAEANLQNNESRKGVIYQELHRRCYGEYPMLIMEYNNLYREKIKFNKMKTIEELIIAQGNIRNKIREYIKNDDVTLINDIPIDVIIEASALNQLILSKEKV